MPRRLTPQSVAGAIHGSDFASKTARVIPKSGSRFSEKDHAQSRI
jgi:hypothetical protein